MSGSAIWKEGLYANNRFTPYQEMESLLYHVPRVSEAGVHITDGEKDLKVFLSLEQPFQNEEEKTSFFQELESLLHRQFSSKMPIHILIRDRLPITKSGKKLRSLFA